VLTVVIIDENGAKIHAALDDVKGHEGNSRRSPRGMLNVL
jgi:hypothetical protein